MTIEGHRIRYDGRLWSVIDVDGEAVHLVSGDDGVCVACPDADLRALIDALPRLP
jgi:hypothetical protein